MSDNVAVTSKSSKRENLVSTWNMATLHYWSHPSDFMITNDDVVGHVSVLMEVARHEKGFSSTDRDAT